MLQNEKTGLYERLSAIIGVFGEYSKCIAAQKSVAPQENDQFLYKVITWTETHYTENFSIDEMAEKMGYSKSYFCSKFKKSSGVTYVEYLTGVRVAQACRLLRQGISVNEVSDQCGFANTSYFIKRFRQITKVTPKQYTQKFID